MKALLLLFTSLFFLNVANAQWQSSNGPYGENIICLVPVGSNLYAGATGGVYLNTGNNNWTVMNTGITDTADGIRLAATGSNIFAGGQIEGGVGVYLSNNGGSSWSALNDSAMNENSPSYVGALGASGQDVFVSTGRNMYFSSNSGSTWVGANTGLNDVATAIVINGGYVFAGSSAGVYISTNNGNTWSLSNTGIVRGVYALLMNGNTLYAATNGGVFLSTDNGSSWVSANAQGQYWSVNALAISGSYLFAGTDYGVYVTSNNGHSWTAINTGLTNLSVSALAVNGPNVYAGFTGGSGVWQRAIADINIGTGIDETSTEPAIEVYPNPATGSIWFNGVKAGNTIVVNDLLGKNVCTVPATGNKEEITLAGISSGVYFFSIIDNNAVIQQGKIIIE